MWFLGSKNISIYVYQGSKRFFFQTGNQKYKIEYGIKKKYSTKIGNALPETNGASFLSVKNGLLYPKREMSSEPTMDFQWPFVLVQGNVSNIYTPSIFGVHLLFFEGAQVIPMSSQSTTVMGKLVCFLARWFGSGGPLSIPIPFITKNPIQTTRFPKAQQMWSHFMSQKPGYQAAFHYPELFWYF